MMKRIAAVLLAMTLLCGLAGCGKSSSRPSDGAPHVPAPRAPSSAASSSEPEPNTSAGEGASLEAEDYLGSWSEDKVYSNKALGLSYALPEGWLYASEEELLDMMDMILDSDILSERGKMMTELGKNRVIYAMMTADAVTGNNIQLMFESMEGVIGGGSMDEKTYARILAAQQDQVLNLDNVSAIDTGDPYDAQLGGQDFLVLPIETTMSDDSKAIQWMYLRRVGERMGVITVTSMDGADAEAILSAFGPLNDVSGGSDTAPSHPGVPTAAGDIGRAFSTMFFDYTVAAAESPAEYDGYTPAEGNRLVLLRVTVKNDFGSTLPMYDTDFQLQWGEGDNDYAWAVDAFNSEMMPLEWELADGKTVTYDMLFEAPAGQSDFSLVYLEEYTDKDGNEKTGDFFSANFTLIEPSAA